MFYNTKRLDEDALEPRCGEKDLKRQLEKEQQELVHQQERMESSMPLAPQSNDDDGDAPSSDQFN